MRILYKQIAEAWKKPEEYGVKEAMQNKLLNWRKQPALVRIDKPTRLDRAHSLGYKAKQSFVMVRTRVRRGGLRKTRPTRGRRQKRMGVTKFVPAKSARLIAEERTAKKFPNLEVLNSYWVWEDGQYKWYEIILVDKTKLTEDQQIQLLGNTPRGKAERGLTSSGKKVRGLRSRRGLKKKG